jgi:hypothetical protein
MGFDKPATDAELTAFYGPEITTTAREIGEERVCADLEMLESFLDQSLPVREPSTFGPISTQDLISKILFNPNATDEQLANAARDLRVRFLSYSDEMVQFYARRAMES